jgi:hypothetical protein
LRAYYGQKSQIQKHLERFKSDLSRLARKPTDSVVPNEPFCVADVTLALRFALEPSKHGLVLERMNTKQHILGFYNPIPPFKQESDHPVLCVIYSLNARDDLVQISYFRDIQEVKIVAAAP